MKRPRAEKLLTHPLFKEVDKNSFKELAGIADAWLGWSWEEYDTASDSDDNSAEQTHLNSEISELSEAVASGPVQTVVLGPNGDMDAVDDKKKKRVSQPRANITSASRTEPETSSSPTKHRRDKSSLGSPKRKRRSHSTSRERRKSDKKKMDEFKAPENQLKEIPDEETDTIILESSELIAPSAPVAPMTSDYILELQQQLKHGELTEEEFAVRLREDSDDLFSSPTRRSVLPLGYDFSFVIHFLFCMCCTCCGRSSCYRCCRCCFCCPRVSRV